MRARITEPAALAEAATCVARNLRLRATEPIYGGVLLAAVSPSAVLEGFDTTTATRVQVPAEVTEPGRVLVSARLLAEITRLLPHQAVELHADGMALTVACGGSRARLPLMPVEEYPARPVAPAVSWWCPAKALISAVARVAPAAASLAASKTTSAGADKIDLTCMALDLPGETPSVRLYATDSASLAAAQVPAEPAGASTSSVKRVLVPAAALEPAARALAGDPDGRIGIGVGDSLLALETAARRITLATVDAPGRGYERILTAAAGEDVVVTRAEVEAALKRVSVHKDAPKARIDVSDNEIRIAVRGQHGTTQEALAVDYTGPALTVGMFTHRLATALHHLGGDLVHVTVPASPSRPWLLRPVTDDGRPDDTYRHMVSPAQLDDEEAA
ncbi:DNA polymerase III subunit beta [Saccharopolyspora hordei]|nr:hypothetical protein [Saccharopolyspora hordei]